MIRDDDDDDDHQPLNAESTIDIIHPQKRAWQFRQHAGSFASGWCPAKAVSWICGNWWNNRNIFGVFWVSENRGRAQPKETRKDQGAKR